MILDEAEPEARALVCVVNRRADYERLHSEQWYRIPVRSAPAGLAAAYLAFYPTAACGPERWSIRWLAPVLAIHVLRRAELLPADVQHPHAADAYYRLKIGGLVALPRTIPARRLRRVTFIPTTVGDLLQADDVADLWRSAQPEASDIWGAGIGRRAMR